MPTDMKALQDFEEEDKLQIKMNDVITIIEGRSVECATHEKNVRSNKSTVCVGASFQNNASFVDIGFLELWEIT